MKEFLKNNKKYIKETAIIIIFGIIINIACFLMCSFYSQAAGETVKRFPYILSDNHADNDYWTAYIENTIINNQTITSFVGNDPYIIFTSYGYPNESTPHIKVNGFVNPSLHSNYDISTFDYVNNTLGISYTKSFTVDISFNSGGSLSFSYSTSNRSDWSGMFGQQTQGTVAGFTYHNRYPVYVSNEVFTSGSPDFLPIILDHYGIGADTTEFTPADLLEETDIIAHNFNNLPTVPSPSYDSSLSVVENVKNFFSWLGSLLSNLFSNLLKNLVDFFNALIRSINNGFNNVFNNIQSLFYPFITFFTGYAQGIQDFIDELTDSQTGIIPFLKTQIANIRTGIASLVDDVIAIKNFLFGVKGFFDTYGVIWNQETWEDALDNSPWLTAVSDNTTTLSQFINGTLNVAEPETLEFTFDFRNNSYCNFGLTSFNFDWYLPYKNSVRLAFLTICILNAVLYFFDEAPNWFSGGGSNKKGDK